MRQAPPNVPWHRVVGANGRLPIARRSPELRAEQHALLLAEDVPFSGQGEQVDLSEAQWPLDDCHSNSKPSRRESRNNP